MTDEAERRMLVWLMDERENGGPLVQTFARTAIDRLASFEAENADLRREFGNVMVALRRGAEEGESESIRAWCALTLDTILPLEERSV